MLCFFHDDGFNWSSMFFLGSDNFLIFHSDDPDIPLIISNYSFVSIIFQTSWFFFSFKLDLLVLGCVRDIRYPKTIMLVLSMKQLSKLIAIHINLYCIVFYLTFYKRHFLILLSLQINH